MPDKCYGGVIGANEGEVCTDTALYNALKYDAPACYARAYNYTCVENNKHAGNGICGNVHTKAACEAVRGEDGGREPEESYDGTTNHCRWIPARTREELDAYCEKDHLCSLSSTDCILSQAAQANQSAWSVQKGVECDKRLKWGCTENVAWLSDGGSCPAATTVSTCSATTWEGCSGGTCTGDYVYTGGSDIFGNTRIPCNQRQDQHSCRNSHPEGTGSCTWTSQCCKWTPKPASKEATCELPGGDAADNFCEYNDGHGPPSQSTVKSGFEHDLFRADAEYSGGCAMVASFRVGKGSATALGSDEADLIGSQCSNTLSWESVAEHVGHNKNTIAEYCANFVPRQTAMSAIATHSPSEVIAKAKAGKFGEIFPADQLFLVTSKPEYGECLLTAVPGTYGVAICVCESAFCNNATTLQFVADKDRGPMRLMKFLDGSLDGLTAKVNAVIPGLFRSDNRLNISAVAGVTEADVDEVLLLDGVSALTTKEELWGVVQDYSTLNSQIAAAAGPTPRPTPSPTTAAPTPAPTPVKQAIKLSDIEGDLSAMNSTEQALLKQEVAEKVVANSNATADDIESVELVQATSSRRGRRSASIEAIVIFKVTFEASDAAEAVASVNEAISAGTLQLTVHEGGTAKKVAVTTAVTSSSTDRLENGAAGLVMTTTTVLGAGLAVALTL